MLLRRFSGNRVGHENQTSIGHPALFGSGPGNVDKLAGDDCDGRFPKLFNTDGHAGDRRRACISMADSQDYSIRFLFYLCPQIRIFLIE
jgi:hypothetical protein